jgi:hypothetical protein
LDDSSVGATLKVVSNVILDLSGLRKVDELPYQIEEDPEVTLIANLRVNQSCLLGH